jgi:hypothetical protein
VLVVAGVIDRGYHWARFGTLAGTYIGVFGQSYRALYPWLPASFPFSNDPLWGVLGPFVAPAKSVFIYDPLLLVVAVVAVASWRQLSTEVQALLLAESTVLVAVAVGYSRLWCWGGDSSWGDRYLTVPVHVLALLAVPLAWRRARTSAHAPAARRAIVAIVAAAAVMQVASLVYPSWLEESQVGDAGGSYLQNKHYLDFRFGLRIENILGYVTGHTADWGLDRVIDGSPVGPRTFLLLPSQPLRSIPYGAAMAVHMSWWALLVAVVAGVALLLRGLLGNVSPEA